MSDSSDEGEPFQLRDYSEDSDGERPNKRRKMTRQPALRARGLGFVSASAQDQDDEEEDPDDERPTMGMGGFQSAFNIGEHSGERDRSPSPLMDSGTQTPNESGRGPSAFSANGKIQKNSFAARMMAKMGHVEGQGLGKSGQGIAAPIQAQLLQSRAGLGHGSAPERPKKTKQEKGRVSQGSTPGTSTPRIKAPPKARYAVAAIESRGLHIPEAMKSIIVDATGAEAKTVSSLSGFSTPTSEAPPTEAMKASARIKMQLQAYADAWDATKEQEARLEQEEEQLQAAIALHENEGQRYQDIVSAFEKVSTDDSNEVREWTQVVNRLQDIQARFADYIEDLDLPEMASACLEAPFRRELAEWDALSDPTHLVGSFQSLGAILELERAITHRHRKKTTPFETLLVLHWFPQIRLALRDWSVYDPDKAVDLIQSWQPILPPWLLYKVLHEIILPKLIEAVRRFPRVAVANSASAGSSNGNSISNSDGGSSSSSSKNRKAQAPDLHSWLFDWWSILSSEDLDLERFPELKTLVKSKVDSTSWPVWKPLLGSRPSKSKPGSGLTSASHARPRPSSTTSSLPSTPAAVDVDDVSFKDMVEEWCGENNLLMRSTGRSDALGRLLYRLQDAERRSKGILVYLQDDVVFDDNGIPYGLDDGLLRKVQGR